MNFTQDGGKVDDFLVKLNCCIKIDLGKKNCSLFVQLKISYEYLSKNIKKSVMQEKKILNTQNILSALRTVHKKNNEIQFDRKIRKDGF